MRRTTRVATVAGLSAALFAVGGSGFWRHAKAPAPAPASAAGISVSSLQGHPVIESGTLADAIGNLQERIRALPGDWNALASLGLAYVQQARVTADPTYYPKAQAVLERSLALHADGNFSAMVGLAALAAARHDFAGALSWGRKAESVNPYNGGVHDAIGDALVELGRYQEAFAELQEAVDRRPDLSSYARASYAHELQGDVAGAVGIMELALKAASTAQDQAWALNQLGDLSFNSGNLAEAGRHYERSSLIDPAFVPARAGLAKVEAARAEIPRAIADYQWVVTRLPSPEYVIALGDLFTVSGRRTEAASQYGLLRVEQQLLKANGVDIDLEIALFDADHGVDLTGGLAAATAEWARRRSIHVADALAWELYANGRPAEALAYSNRALALGTRNALFFFHRGMIERALGRIDSARRDLGEALKIDPNFSILWSKPAAALLARLGGPR